MDDQELQETFERVGDVAFAAMQEANSRAYYYIAQPVDAPAAPHAALFAFFGTAEQIAELRKEVMRRATGA